MPGPLLFTTISAGQFKGIVTIAVFELVLPFTSVTVNVTILSPISLKLKLFLLSTFVAIPQLSVEPLSMSSAVIVTFPVLSS